MHTTQDTEDCKLSIRLLDNDDIVVVPDASSVDEHWSQYVNRYVQSDAPDPELVSLFSGKILLDRHVCYCAFFAFTLARVVSWACPGLPG